MTDTDPPAGLPISTLAPRGLEEIVAALRQLAISALDVSEPLAAARIAGLADQIEAEAWPVAPPRPGYRRRG